MKYLFSLALLVCLPLFVRAQDAAPKGHTLIIFSADGDKFFLVFDGVKINTTPQARVEAPNIANGYGRAKIIFDNEKLPDVNQMIQLEGVDPGWNEVTYVIKKKTDKKGNIVCSIKNNSWRSLNEGAPKGVPDPNAQEITEPVTPVVKEEQQQVIHMKLPDPSVTIRVEGDPNTPVINPNPNTNPLPAPKPTPAPKQKPAPVIGCTPPSDVSEIEEAIKAESFAADRMNVAKQYLESNCLTTAQVKQLAPLFTFEGDRLEFVKAAYPKVADRANYWKLNSVFTFSSSKDALNAFLKGKK